MEGNLLCPIQMLHCMKETMQWSMTQMAAMTHMITTAMAAVTPAMVGASGDAVNSTVNNLIASATSFNGDGRAPWADWLRSLINRMTAVKIPHADWVAVILSLLTGAAAAYATSNGLKDNTPWDLFIATMAAGPWASTDTFFSLLFRLTRGNLGNGNAQETVSQLEKIKAKLQFVLPFQFWVFALLVNLQASFRETLLTGPDGKDWLSYEELRSVVLGKAAAQKSVNASAGNNTKNTKADTKNVSWKDKLINKNGNGRPNATSQSRGDPGASSSTPPTKKRKQDQPICFGCGSTTHKISDRHPNGTPVCPMYDETKVRKGKYPQFPKPPGNGKGK